MSKRDAIYNIKKRIENIYSILEEYSYNCNFDKVSTNIKCDLSEISTSLECLDESVDNGLDFKEIVENLDDSIFITDGEGKVLYVNPSYERNTGIRPEEVLNCYVADILEEGKLFKEVGS